MTDEELIVAWHSLNKRIHDKGVRIFNNAFTGSAETKDPKVTAVLLLARTLRHLSATALMVDILGRLAS